jgi:methyl-accepting chemotaxis protein
MQSMNQEVASGAEAGIEARKSLEEIDRAIRKVIADATLALESSSEMASQATGVNDAIASVAAISEESASSADEMSAAAARVTSLLNQARKSLDEQLTINGMVNQSAVDMKQLGQEVQELVSKFDSFKWDRRRGEGPERNLDERRRDTIHEAAYRYHTGKESFTKKTA